MSKDDTSPSSGGTNWTLGVDKLTTPTLEFLGGKIRDTVRSYLNSKARERAAVRKFEREFFIRQSELLYYGADQYALSFEHLELAMLDRAFTRLERLIKIVAEDGSVAPLRVLEIVAAGATQKEEPLSSPLEMALYYGAASLLDSLIATYSAQSMFHYSFVPSTVHRQDPTASDEALDALMADPETLEQLQKEFEPLDHKIGERLAEMVAKVYGMPWPIPDETKS